MGGIVFSDDISLSEFSDFLGKTIAITDVIEEQKMDPLVAIYVLAYVMATQTEEIDDDEIDSDFLHKLMDSAIVDKDAWKAAIEGAGKK